MDPARLKREFGERIVFWGAACDCQKTLAFGTPLDLEGSLAHEVATDLYTRVSADLRARLGVVAAWGLELGLGWDRGTFPAGTWERTSRVRARAAFLRRRADPGQGEENDVH